MKNCDDEMGGMSGVHAADLKTLKRGDFFKLSATPNAPVYVKGDVRIGVLFPYIGNVTVASVTGDDWETEIYHQELEA